MALDTQVSNDGRNAGIDAMTGLVDGGKLRFYDAPKPANAQTALTTQTLLAELTLGTPSAAAAAAGVATFNAISPDLSANATGTAAWATLTKPDGTRVVDGTVGTSGANINLNSVSIVAGAPVSLDTLTLAMPAAGA